MLARYQTLLDAFRACDIVADLRTTETESGPQPELSGRITTNIYAGADSVRQFAFSAWFAARGKWLCIESTPLHSLPSPVGPARITSMRQATACANKAGEWASLFHHMEGNTIIARVSTLAPAGVPLEDLVRTLVDDLQQAIDTTHYLFALAIRDGVCTPELIEDTDWVEHSLAMATAGRRKFENGQQADPPPPDDDIQEEYEEEAEEEIEIRADDEDQYEED